MNTRIVLGAILGISSMTPLLACEPSGPAAAPVKASELTADEYKAAYTIAVARCDRQTSSCDPYPSRSACLEAKLLLSAREARLLECSTPVAAQQLARCVAIVRSGTCGTGIAHLDECRRWSLCPYVDSEEGTESAPGGV
jgi:hypothetical protein